MTAIFVLGMHRCGTSVVAGLLRALGVEFGPLSDLMPPSRLNPKGFFEHIALNGINVELMVKLGGEWYAPPVLPLGWENSKELDGIQKRAAEQIEHSFGKYKLWGFKDPRTCMTFPFWRKVVQGPIRVVIVGRHPMDAARSLQDAQRILASEALELWFRHMVGAFLGSHGLPRHVVFYEDILNDLRGEFGRLASFVGVPVSDAMMAEAMKFSDKQLQHFETEVSDVSGGLPAKARKAFLTIRAFVDVARAGKLEPEDEDNIERILGSL